MSQTTSPKQPNLRKLSHFLAFGFGSGQAKYAPGTVGSAVACVLFLPVVTLPEVYIVVLVCIASLIGIYVCGQTAQDMQMHDHQGIVWDEFVGMWITLIAVPNEWHWILLAFVLFRAFDIFKPWPIGWVDQHTQGGLGIMLDDILAGLAALACLQTILLFV